MREYDVDTCVFCTVMHSQPRHYVLRGDDRGRWSFSDATLLNSLIGKQERLGSVASFLSVRVRAKRG